MRYGSESAQWERWRWGVATGAESLGIVRMALVAGLIACVVGLKFAGNH